MYGSVTVLDVFELKPTSPRYSKWGIEVRLSKPYTCRSIDEVKALPFIYKRFSPGYDTIYLTYFPDLRVHGVILDPGVEKRHTQEKRIIALARLRDLDTDAVDTLKTA